MNLVKKRTHYRHQELLNLYYHHNYMATIAEKDEKAYQLFKMQPYASCNNKLKLVKIKVA